MVFLDQIGYLLVRLAEPRIVNNRLSLLAAMETGVLKFIIGNRLENMSFLDKLQNITKRIGYHSPFGGRSSKQIKINYEKYCNLVRSLRPKAEHLTMTERDPRVHLMITPSQKNIYYIQFLLSGDAVEDVAGGRLVLRNDILAKVTDEFERNDVIIRFEEDLEAQQDLLRKKNYYVELELTLPEFDFEKKAFEFEFTGLLSNRSIALHDLRLIWDINLTRFHPHFSFKFSSDGEAKLWKQRVSGMKLGVIFNVVTDTPRLWRTAMPATICYAVGFAFVDGLTSQIMDNIPVKVSGVPGPHEQAVRNRGQIFDLVTKLLKDT